MRIHRRHRSDGVHPKLVGMAVMMFVVLVVWVVPCWAYGYRHLANMMFEHPIHFVILVAVVYVYVRWGKEWSRERRARKANRDAERDVQEMIDHDKSAGRIKLIIGLVLGIAVVATIVVRCKDFLEYRSLVPYPYPQ